MSIDQQETNRRICGPVLNTHALKDLDLYPGHNGQEENHSFDVET